MNTIGHPKSYDRQESLKRFNKLHQEWLKAHETGQMFFQLYRCIVCGFESSHDGVIEHLQETGCRV